MKKIAKAKIYWIPFGDGGRKKVPSGPRYSTVVHFKNDDTSLQEQAWSIVIEFDEKNVQHQETMVTIWFLVDDNPNAPIHFLNPGNEFELLEGYRIVARGVILNTTT